MAFPALSPGRAVLRAGLPTLRVIAPSTAHASPVCASKQHSAAALEQAQRPQRPVLSASAASSTLAERESSAAEQTVDVSELGLSRDFSAKYELMQPIGRGSFKTTHLAVLRSTNYRVAVGVLPKERSGVTVEHNLHMIEQEVRKMLPRCCHVSGPVPPRMTSSHPTQLRTFSHITTTVLPAARHSFRDTAACTWARRQDSADADAAAQIDITRSMQDVPGVIRMHGVYEASCRHSPFLPLIVHCPPTPRNAAPLADTIREARLQAQLAKLYPLPPAGRQERVHRDGALPGRGPGAVPQGAPRAAGLKVITLLSP